MENHNVYFVEYVNNSEIQPGSSQVPKIRLISQSQSSHVVAPPPAPHQATVQQATSVQQSTSIPPPVHIPSASVLQISKTRRSGRVQKAAIIKAPAGQSAHVRPSTRVRQAENVRQVASVKQSANVSRPAAHIRQPTRVRQPESDRQAAGMGQPINVSLPAPQARQSTRARQSGNETQAASVRLVADAGQSMNIRQTAVVQSFESILQPVCTRQTAILRPFVNNPQSTSAQQVTIVPSFTNVQQRRSSTHFANIQQPANVQQSADNQPPVSSQQSTSKQQSASNQQPVNDQQPASIEQSTSVQQSTSTGQTASVQQSMKNRVIFGNVVQLSQAELKKIVANAQLKQKNTGSLAVRLQNDKLVKFIYRDNGNEILGISNFRFKITLVYRSLLRKWYISSGYSFVPEAINLKGRLKSGTYNPVSKEVVDIVYDVRDSIQAYITRLTAVHEFFHNARRSHRDMQFFLHPTLRTLELILSEDTWPSDLPKFGRGDVIVIRLTLDKELRVSDITYEHVFSTVMKKMENEFRGELHAKLQNFYFHSLTEAFERFMGEASCNEQDNSESS